MGIADRASCIRPGKRWPSPGLSIYPIPPTVQRVLPGSESDPLDRIVSALEKLEERPAEEAEGRALTEPLQRAMDTLKRSFG